MSQKNRHYILSLDIGGTKLAGALFDRSHNPVRYSTTLTHADEGAEPVFERLAGLAETLLQREGADRRSIRCVGAGCAGPLDSEAGVIYAPPNLHCWDDFPLKDRLEEHFGVPAAVDNDANAAALGEQRFGAGVGYRHILYITASTGIGAGLVLDGRIYRGADYGAGEFGHIVVARNGPRCNCGGVGCLEAHASGTAIAKRARREIRRAPDSLLTKVRADKGADVSAEDVFAAARRGDALAGTIIRDAAEYLGLGIVSVIHLLNPEVIIIGGGMARAGKLLFEPLRRTVADRAQKHLAQNVRIVRAKLGGKAGIYGSLADALDRCSACL
jgi:glucokinase